MLATFLISLAQLSVYQKQPEGVQYDVTSTTAAGMMATRRTMTCRIESGEVRYVFCGRLIRPVLMLSERAATSNSCTRDHSQCENFDNTPTVVDTMEPVVFSRAIGLCGIGTGSQRLAQSGRQARRG